MAISHEEYIGEQNFFPSLFQVLSHHETLIISSSSNVKFCSLLQEKLLLSLLPRFVALEIIKDIAEEEDHRKLLSAQFHKIYIHCYKDVR